MAHPFYYQCLSCLNQPVTVRLVTGETHCGVLQRVTQEGIYLSPLPGHASTSKNQSKVCTADNKENRTPDGKEVFFAPFFFPFGLLAGFTLGLATGALARPYPYYPYGGYGGYPYY
ncbi:hypothetical protein [Effusibacillus consociatus]|uniref:Uncharacterized protein n=1 Tax=Effusibacillus consociatus TaxID=1117041 RepID=A0ABV9PUA8_9BACL